MANCETCLWACFNENDDELSDSEDCEFYHPINDDETLEIEYVEKLRKDFAEEWDEYMRGWD